MAEFPKNQAELTGEVVRDPRVREFGENRKVANINLRVNDDNGRVTFVNVVCWDQLGDVGEACTQGTRVYVKGRLVKGRVWTDREGNQRDPGLEVHADELEILGVRNGPETPERIKF